MSSIEAKRAFLDAYLGCPNLMTPEVIGYRTVGSFHVELSRGDFMGKNLYGVTLLDVHDPRPGHALYGCFESRERAERYIDHLKTVEKIRKTVEKIRKTVEKIRQSDRLWRKKMNRLEAISKVRRVTDLRTGETCTRTLQAVERGPDGRLRATRTFRAADYPCAYCNGPIYEPPPIRYEACCRRCLRA